MADISQAQTFFDYHQREIAELAERIGMPISTAPRSDAAAPEPKEGERPKRGPRKGLFGYAFVPARTVRAYPRWYIRITDPQEIEVAAAILASSGSPYGRSRKHDTCVIVSLQMPTPPKGWDPAHRHAEVADPGLLHGHGRVEVETPPELAGRVKAMAATVIADDD